MRIDFSKQQFSSDVEQQYIRLVRVVRTFMGALVVAGIGAIVVVTSAPREGRWVDGLSVQGIADPLPRAQDEAQASTSAIDGVRKDPVSSSTDPALGVVERVVQHG